MLKMISLVKGRAPLLFECLLVGELSGNDQEYNSLWQCQSLRRACLNIQVAGLHCFRLTQVGVGILRYHCYSG